MRNSRPTQAHRLAPWLAAGAAAAVYIIGCGGSGGSSSASTSASATTSTAGSTTATTGATSTTGNRGPISPAPPPTCPGPALARALQGSVGGGSPYVFVPPTSIPRPGDAGVRAHTNHLILIRPGASRSGGPQGLSPTQICKAYNVPSNGGSGAIAIVDAYDYPQALNDFNVFSSTFSLPTEPSTTPTASSNAVFQVVYAGGAEPTSDGGWAQEMALDMEWAHAVAPKAKIFLVEAASSTITDLMTAVGVAAKLPGVRQVGISFGSTEDACTFATYDSVFLQSGVAFFAATGDTSGEKDFPAESMNVVGVGGTTLNTAADGTWISETAWNSVGGGPSQFEPRPVFQDVVESITKAYRADSDIAADGDPNTGVSVYDSFPYQGSSGWQVYGGTSAATPIIAGIANASGAVRASSQAQNAAFYAALGSGNFHDITTGQSGSYSAGVGYDFLTGVGTPNGNGGF